MTIHPTKGMATKRTSAHRCQSIWRGLYIALCGCSLLPSAANAGPDPLITRGKQMARIACSQCHVVAPDQEFSPTVNVSAPPFEEIANRQATSERSLQRFISKTHWDGQTIPMTMPAPGLTKQETIAVARYIMSLRKP
jgi:mono/diheme cytochrome c family protein